MRFNKNNICKTSAYAIAAFMLTQSGAAVAQSADDQGADANNGGLGIILVTASKRSVDMQKESRAINVVTSEELVRKGVTDAQAVQDLVPGLTINRNATQLQISIRGVGDRTINSATDPAVALNIDGAYMPKSYQGAGSFFDLERVEVLKGPQGTLYGRNASSGAINLITAKPKFDFGGFVELEYGNFNQKRGLAAINLPISDNVALRVSGQVIDRDGYLTDGYNDDKSEALRAQLLIAPGDDTSLLLSGFYTHIGGIGQAAVIGQRFGNVPATPGVVDPTNPYAGPSDPAVINRVGQSNPGSAGYFANQGFQDLDVYGLSATFEHKTDWANFTVMPSYVGSHLKSLNKAAIVVAGYEDTKAAQFALEGRISSSDDSRVKWVVGAFGAIEDVTSFTQSRIPLLGATGFLFTKVTPNRDDRTWAIFGEMNYPVSDEFRLIAGGRYTWEKKIITGYSAGYGQRAGESIGLYPLLPGSAGFPGPNYAGADLTGFPFPGFGVANPTEGTETYKKFNFRLGAEYDVAPDVMLYATVSTGFKAGGFFDGVGTDFKYKPEKLTSYQGGIKSRFFDNRVQLNVEGFYWDFKDKQETFLGFIFPVGNVLQTRNAGKVSMYGLDASLAVQISDNDRLSLDGNYLHSKYDEYNYIIPFGPGGSNILPFSNCTGSNVGGQERIDCSGQELVRAPKWTGRVAYTRTQPIGDAGTLIFDASMKFSSSYWLTNDFTPLGRHPSYQTFDAALTWESPNENISLTGYVKNISDEVIYNGGLQSGAITNTLVGSIGAPRTYGARLRVKF